MRVLHCYKAAPPDGVGGVPEAITLLAKGMSARHQSSVLAATHRGAGRSYIWNGIPVETVASLGTVMSMPIAPGFPFALAKRARDVDLVALHHPFPLNDVGAVIGRCGRTPIIVHWHSEIVGRRPLSDLVAPLVRHTLARARRIIVSHPSLIENSPFLSRLTGKCAVIPYGIDVDYWQGLDASQRGRADALRARHPRLIVAIGRLVPYKGYHALITALRDLDATAVIVGDGPLGAELERYARQSGVDRRIVFAGALPNDDLKIHLHAAKVFAFASVSVAEAFGIVQIEAMAAGLPIVNADLPTAVPHVARDGIEALTVRANDPAALAAAIGRLLDDRTLARRLGAAGRERAAAEYDLGTFVARTEKAYELAAFGAAEPCAHVIGSAI